LRQCQYNDMTQAQASEQVQQELINAHSHKSSDNVTLTDSRKTTACIVGTQDCCVHTLLIS